MTDFVDYERDKAPAWLQRGQGANLLESFGIVRDAMAQGARDATTAWALTAAPDAVSMTCADAFLDGPINENELAFAEDVAARAMEIWGKAGTVAALDVVVPLCGFPTYTITEYPASPTQWTEVVVAVRAPFAVDVPPFSSWIVGPAVTIGPDLVIGFGPVGAYLRRLVRMIRKVKAAHTTISLVYWITYPTTSITITPI
jgi:hypothetical protein